MGKTKYMVVYTDSVRGSLGGRDDGQPVRRQVVLGDKIEAYRFFKEKLDEEGNRYGWERPTISTMQVYELDEEAVVDYLDRYEKTKNFGEGI